MKHLLIFATLLCSLTTIAQLSENNFGRYVDEKAQFGYDIMPIEEMNGFCFYLTENTYDEGVTLVEAYAGYGQCTKTNKSYKVEMEGSERIFFLEFALNKEQKPILKVHVEGKPDRILNRILDGDQLENWYQEYMTDNDPYYDTDYSDGEVYTDGEDVEYYDEGMEEIGAIKTYSRQDGSAVSILPAEDGTGNAFFAVVGIDQTNCDNNMLDGILLPGTKEGEYYAESGGCTFVTIVVKESSVIVTEKNCKSMNREKCANLSGVYNLSE